MLLCMLLSLWIGQLSWSVRLLGMLCRLLLSVVLLTVVLLTVVLLTVVWVVVLSSSQAAVSPVSSLWSTHRGWLGCCWCCCRSSQSALSAVW